MLNGFVTHVQSCNAYDFVRFMITAWCLKSEQNLKAHKILQSTFTVTVVRFVTGWMFIKTLCLVSFTYRKCYSLLVYHLYVQYIS